MSVEGCRPAIAAVLAVWAAAGPIWAYEGVGGPMRGLYEGIRGLVRAYIGGIEALYEPI